MEKIIYFVRHGQTLFNKMHIVQGSGVDSDLNEEGIKQGASLHRQYRHLDFELIMTSGLKRTWQTVQPFIDDGIPWEKFPELNEISWGIHEGAKGTPEMRQNYLDLVGNWNRENYDAKIEGGESATQLGERVGKFMEYLKSRKERRILVCSHGRTMTCISCFLEERPLKDMVLFKYNNTGVTKTIYNGNRFVIECLNDVSHLQPKDD